MFSFYIAPSSEKNKDAVVHWFQSLIGRKYWIFTFDTFNKSKKAMSESYMVQFPHQNTVNFFRCCDKKKFLITMALEKEAHYVNVLTGFSTDDWEFISSILTTHTVLTCVNIYAGAVKICNMNLPKLGRSQITLKMLVSRKKGKHKRHFSKIHLLIK